MKSQIHDQGVQIHDRETANSWRRNMFRFMTGTTKFHDAENSDSWRKFFDFMPSYSDSWREKNSWPEFEFMTTKKCSWREIMMVHDGIENSWREKKFHDENFSNSWRRIKFMTEKESTFRMISSWWHWNLTLSISEGTTHPQNYCLGQALFEKKNRFRSLPATFVFSGEYSGESIPTWFTASKHPSMVLSLTEGKCWWDTRLWRGGELHRALALALNTRAEDRNASPDKNRSPSKHPSIPTWFKASKHLSVLLQGALQCQKLRKPQTRVD